MIGFIRKPTKEEEFAPIIFRSVQDEERPDCHRPEVREFRGATQLGRGGARVMKQAVRCGKFKIHGFGVWIF